MNSVLLSDRTYVVLVALRLVLVFVSFGYLHPDSFFQSSEVVAGDVFGFDVEKPWEFDSGNPCRSIVSAFAVTGIPLLLLKALSVVVPPILNAYVLYLVPRLYLFCASFVIDYIVWKLSGKLMSSVITAASSWTVLVMLLQPFSNTSETLLLAVFSYVVFRSKVKPASDYLLLGILSACGIFNRFTFVFYAFPIVLYLVYEFLIDAEKKTASKNGVKWEVALGLFVGGFFTTSLFFVAVDSVYFGTWKILVNGSPIKLLDFLSVGTYTGVLTGAVEFSGGWTVTPLNSFRYNLNEENLAKHGLSPKISHLIFHVPALFGPLVVIGLLPYYQWLDDQLAVLLNQAPKKRVSANKKARTTAVKPRQISTTATPGTEAPSSKEKVKLSLIKLVMVGVVCSSTFFLSLSPHQEMRFLLPNIFPLILLGSVGIFGHEEKKDKKEKEEKDPYQQYWAIAWIVFNVVMLIVMGFMHQGGVVRSLTSFQWNTPTDGTHHLIYYHTYMPPRYLLAIPKHTQQVPPFSVHDLKGAELAELRKTIFRIKESVSYSDKHKIYLVTPATVELQGLLNTTATGGIDGHFSLVTKYWPHLSMEDAPQKVDHWFGKLSLDVYEYKQNK